MERALGLYAYKFWWKLKQFAYLVLGIYRHTDERVCPAFPDGNFYDHFRIYHFASQFVQGRTVLDVGCGTGYGTHYMLQKGARLAIGIDNSTEAIRYAKTHRIQHLEYRWMDAQQMTFPDASFDVVVSVDNLEHLPDPARNIMEIRRVLRPSGILILSTPNKELSSPGLAGTTNPFHFREFYFEELERLLRGSFRHLLVIENKKASGSPIGRDMKEHRVAQGKVGIEHDGATQVTLDGTVVNLEGLRNDYSFVAIAR